jgi:hypothetical protein
MGDDTVDHTKVIKLFPDHHDKHDSIHGDSWETTESLSLPLARRGREATDLDFYGEMLIPKINADVYYAIYEFENWLRRICLTAYMVKYGEEWSVKLQSLNSRGRAERPKDLSYLGVDSTDNLIWAATFGELERLILESSVWDHVYELTHFPKDKLSAKLSELREIRNILAHNRALSSKTAIIVEGLSSSLEHIVTSFKQQVLYNSTREIENAELDAVQYFLSKTRENDWSRFQPVLFHDDRFFELVSLPAGSGPPYSSARKLLTAYEDVLDSVIAFLINKDGGEYGILLPRRISTDKMQCAIDIFVLNQDVWTSKKFIEQNPEYACHPKIWFYENGVPIDE